MTKRDSTDSEIRERAVVAYGEGVRVPPGALLLEGFREWAHSDAFPETGRIDFVAGAIEVEMSPEDLQTHGTVKTAIAAELFARIARPELGFVFADRTRVTAPAAELSAEPDVVAVLFESLDRGSVRQVPAASHKPGRSPGGRPATFVELEGAPDLVVEITSDSSVSKDTKRLPPRYARAGIGELWLIDARGKSPRLEIQELAGFNYRIVKQDPDGWAHSRFLDGRVRLSRQPTRHAGWLYELEVDE